MKNNINGWLDEIHQTGFGLGVCATKHAGGWWGGGGVGGERERGGQTDRQTDKTPRTNVAAHYHKSKESNMKISFENHCTRAMHTYTTSETFKIS